MPTAIVIPARLHSTRLPQKLLLRETGKSLIQHTYEAASRAQIPSSVIVATDHAAIVEEVESFGGRAVLTDVNASSGTDRVAEVAAAMPEFDTWINVQGDEPEVSGAAIDLVATILQENTEIAMATVATPIRQAALWQDPACVKVVCDLRGRALYFSRAPIPAHRESPDSLPATAEPLVLQHVGLYGYRRDFVTRFPQLPPSPLEQLEKLEQLRVLQAGYAIQVGVVEEAAVGIDTREDYRSFVERVSAML